MDSRMESMQLRHLEQAERHIVQAEIAMTRLNLLIERLRANGRLTEREEQSREAMQDTLDRFYKHRELILNELSRRQGRPASRAHDR